MCVCVHVCVRACVRVCVVCVCVYAYIQDTRAYSQRVLFRINFSTHALALLRTSFTTSFTAACAFRGVVSSMRQARPVTIVELIPDSKYHTPVA